MAVFLSRFTLLIKCEMAIPARKRAAAAMAVRGRGTAALHRVLDHTAVGACSCHRDLVNLCCQNNTPLTDCVSVHPSVHLLVCP